MINQKVDGSVSRIDIDGTRYPTPNGREGMGTRPLHSVRSDDVFKPADRDHPAITNLNPLYRNVTGVHYRSFPASLGGLVGVGDADHPYHVPRGKSGSS